MTRQSGRSYDPTPHFLCMPLFLQLATAALRRSFSPSIPRTACRGLASAANLKVSPPTPQKKERIKYFKVYRYDPEQDQSPYLSTYPVNLDECGPMVLGKASCHDTPFASTFSKADTF